MTTANADWRWKMDFTPGPHEIVPADHLGAAAYAVKASDGDLLAVGCLKADASLFAAAPELYETLKHVRELLVAYGPRYIEKATRLADAALAKARGEQVSANA